MIDYNIINPEPEEYLEGEIIYDFSEFSGMNVEDIKKSVLNFKDINKIDFHNKTSQNDFYENSKTYIYDLLGANWNLVGPANKINKFIPGIMDLIKNHPGDSFMEFGGGLGVFTEIVSKHTQKKVTYVDVKGYISDFALWRFKKYNLKIDYKIIPQDNFEFDKKFDIIFSDAVWEHLNPVSQIEYLVKLDKYLNNGGIIILIIDLSGEEENMPMHYHVDMNKIFTTMESLGYSNIWNNNLFATVWYKN